MTTSPVWRLLRRNISPWQLAGYALANLVGLAIVLTAIQFFTDVDNATSGDDDNRLHDYLVVSKSIGLLNRNTAFSEREIENLEQQPWVEAVGRFEASRFRASISVDFQGHSLSTETFFESLPAQFFDRLPRDWNFNPDQGEVPIILSRDYLALYNFGFASSRGLPKLRDNEVSLVPLQITIAGRGHTAHLRGYIAGFSSRISTIAVPVEFMTWANDNYGSETATQGPSRLVVEVNDPGNPEVRKYLSDNGLDIAGDKLDNSETGFFLRLVTGVVIGVGIVISLLALCILTLSIFLLIHKNREKLRDLMLLGYSAANVARYYYRLTIAINVSIMMLSIIIVLTIRTQWTHAISALDMIPGSITAMLLTAATITAAVTTLNIVTIHRLITRCRT